MFAESFLLQQEIMYSFCFPRQIVEGASLVCLHKSHVKSRLASLQKVEAGIRFIYLKGGHWGKILHHKQATANPKKMLWSCTLLLRCRRSTRHNQYQLVFQGRQPETMDVFVLSPLLLTVTSPNVHLHTTWNMFFVNILIQYFPLNIWG